MLSVFNSALSSSCRTRHIKIPKTQNISNQTTFIFINKFKDFLIRRRLYNPRLRKNISHAGY